MILSSIPDRKYSRIISLVPSQTELLHGLGLDEEVVGITKFCVHPNTWFKNKKKIGGTKDIHIQEILSLNPDLIIANKEENIKEQIENLANNCDVWVTDVNSLE
ncbi:MAG: helical backbone metal receptor, partial [Ginsengibacter sp.]